LSAISRLKVFHLLHFSKPVANRAIYKAICRRPVARILEVGVGDTERAQRMIGLAEEGVVVEYVGVDRFELSDDPQSLGLKEAYQRLRATGAKIRLVPGEVDSALARSANDMGQFDLVVISSSWSETALARAWFYLPRMLRPDSMVFIEQGDAGQIEMCQLAVAEIERRAVRRRAA